MNDFPLITQSPAVMGGKPCIRGKRVTVGMIVGQIGAGRSIEDLLGDHPYLTREEILESIRYAAWRTQEREVHLASAPYCSRPGMNWSQAPLCPFPLHERVFGYFRSTGKLVRVDGIDVTPNATTCRPSRTGVP